MSGLPFFYMNLEKIRGKKFEWKKVRLIWLFQLFSAQTFLLLPKILRTLKMLKFQKPKNIGSLTWILLVLIKKKECTWQRCDKAESHVFLEATYDREANERTERATYRDISLCFAWKFGSAHEQTKNSFSWAVLCS